MVSLVSCSNAILIWCFSMNSISSGSLLFIPLQFHCSIFRLYVLSALGIVMLGGGGGVGGGLGGAGGAVGVGRVGGLDKGSFVQIGHI